MTSELYGKMIKVCKGFIDTVDEQNDKIIIVLHHDIEWLNTIKAKTKGDQNLKTISDTEEFQAFIHQNGCAKVYININLIDENGIDLAENLGLKHHFANLFFVSVDPPSQDQLDRIDKMGGKYINKSDVLEKIIYPRGE